MLKIVQILALCCFSLQAADGWLGTWKLDPSRCRFVNTDAFKDGILVITAEKGNYVLNFTMTMVDGKVVHESFKQPLKGGNLIPVEGTPVENGVVEMPNDHEWVYKYYSSDKKFEAARYVRLSKDGKTQEADMRSKKDGKEVIEHEVAVKQ